MTASLKDEIDIEAEEIRRDLELAVLFHETYERLAPEFGYETRKDTKLLKLNTPNGQLMLAVAHETNIAILKSIKERLPAKKAVKEPTPVPQITKLRQYSADFGKGYDTCLEDVINSLGLND